MSKEFGFRLEKLLKTNNISQKELADCLELNEATISRYISGEREPKPEVIANIATILHTTSDYLLGITKSTDEENFGQIKALLTRNINNMDDNEKKELISELLAAMGTKT